VTEAPPAAARPASWIFPALAAALAGALTLRLIDDPDYFTHLAVGRALIDAGLRPLLEPFQWGWSEPLGREELPFRLGLAVWRGLAGDAGVSAAVALLSALAIGLTARSGVAPRSWPRVALALALLSLVVLVARFRLVARPELPGLVLFGGVLLVAFRWARSGAARWLGAALVLLVAWAGVHASWALGAILGIATAVLLLPPDRWRARWAAAARRLHGAALGAGLAALVPIAAFTWHLIGQLGSGPLATVTELQPTSRFDELFWPLIAAVAAAAVMAWGAPRGRIGRLLLVALSAAAGLGVVRNAAFAALALVPPALAGLDGWRGRGGRPVAVLAFLAGVALTVSVALHSLAERDPPPGFGLDSSEVASDAAGFARQLPGPLLNGWDLGGWLDLTWAGHPRTFLDGRLLDAGRVSDHDAVVEATAPAETLDRLGIRTVLLRPISRSDGTLLSVVPWLLGRGEWRLVRASDGLVFVRAPAPRGVVPLPAAAGWRLVEREAERTEARSPSARHAPFVRAWALTELGERPEASRAYRAAAARDPETARGYPTLAAPPP
jgi:hypothetical protein